MSAATETYNDLTTDAVPNPPENRNLGNDSNNEYKESDGGIRADQSSLFNHKRLRSKLTRLQRTYPSYPAQATIININNSKDVHVGDTIYYNMEHEKRKSTVDVNETSAIRNLFSSKEALNREDLLFVASHVDETWRDIARALDYSEGQIEQFDLDHSRYGMKEVIYQMLLDWMQNEPPKATKGNLSHVLWTHNQKIVVKKWAEKCM